MLLTDPVETTETVSVGVWVRVGSRDEGPLERGFAHFLEHMLFKGTSRRSALDIAKAVDRVGGSLNAFTEKEDTCYYCTVPSEWLGLAVDVLGDMITASVLATEELEREREIILNEIQALQDSPEELGHEYFLQGVFGDHPLAHTITGSSAEVQVVQGSDLRRFYRDRYTARLMEVSVAGRFDESRVVPLMEQTFIERCDPADRNADHPERTPPTRSVFRQYRPDKFSQLHIYCGRVLPAATQWKDYYTAMVLSTVAGESMSSRLFQRLREEQGLCYSVYTFRSHYTDLSSWSDYAGTSPENGKRLVDELARELGRLRREPPSVAEVKDAKAHLAGSLVFTREDMEARMKRMARQRELFGRPLEFDESMAILDAVSSADVGELAERLIQADQFDILVYGSEGFSKSPGEEIVLVF